MPYIRYIRRVPQKADVPGIDVVVGTYVDPRSCPSPRATAHLSVPLLLGYLLSSVSLARRSAGCLAIGGKAGTNGVAISHTLNRATVSLHTRTRAQNLHPATTKLKTLRSLQNCMLLSFYLCRACETLALAILILIAGNCLRVILRDLYGAR